MKVTEYHVMNRSEIRGEDGNKYRRGMLKDGRTLCIQRKVPGVRGWEVVLYGFSWEEARSRLQRFVDGRS